MGFSLLKLFLFLLLFITVYSVLFTVYIIILYFHCQDSYNQFTFLNYIKILVNFNNIYMNIICKSDNNFNIMLNLEDYMMNYFSKGNEFYNNENYKTYSLGI